MSAESLDVDLDSLARAFQSSVLPAVSIPNALTSAEIAVIRRSVDAMPFETLDLAHRGRYEHSEHALYEPIEDRLRALTEAVVGHPVAILKHRWLRLRRGDYSLVRDDIAWLREVGSAPIELSLDFSASSSAEAEVVYTHRSKAYFTMPQRPGELGVVLRGPTVSRYDRYLTHRLGGAIVHRLRIALGYM